MSLPLDGSEPAPVSPDARQYFVRMRDGVHLATDVYLPDADVPVPAILVRLPYDKNGRYVFMDVVARRATRAGYALVVQDVRGKYRSEGDPLGPVNEAPDGYDTISWIAASDWCDGHVGMFGDSYYGFTQYAAVSSGHPALRAIVPRMTNTRIGIDEVVVRSGVSDVPWGASFLYHLQCWSGPFLNDEEPDFAARPLLAAFDDRFNAIGYRSHWFDSLVPHPIPSRIYPDGHPYRARAIPTLHCVGWWDSLAIAHMRDVEAFAAIPEWAAVQYLWMDSIDHENYHIDEAGELPWGDHDFDDGALERMLDNYIGPALRFFDVFLKGTTSPHEHPRVQWHLAHGGYQRSETWPPPGATTKTMYLSDLSRMTTLGGSLVSTAPDAAQSGSWSYDPDNPVRTTVMSTWAFLAEYPDESAVGDRPDVAVFDSALFEDDLDLAGPVLFWARISSTAPSADVFVRLLDVGPDGNAHMILRGQGVFLTPSADALYRVELGHTGYRVRAGHRLRLHLTGSDFPEYLLNPSTGENRWTATKFLSATHTLHTNSVAPARIELTVVSALD